MFKPRFSIWARVARGEKKEVGIINANTTSLCILEHTLGKTVWLAPFVSSYSADVPHS